MADNGRSRHGLEARIERLRGGAPGDAALQLSVRASAGHVNLRGRPGDAVFVQAVESALQQPLPLAPNTVSEGRCRLFWLGPDEWLLVANREDMPGLVRRLEEDTQGLHAAVNDLSGGLVQMRLAGAGAGEVLAAGCTLDLHPAAFPPGRCAQTGLARAPVLLCPLERPAGYDLVVRRSFADYLLAWLQRAAGPRGLAVELE